MDLEKIIRTISPEWAYKRAKADTRVQRIYDAGTLGHHQHKDPLSPNFSADAVLDHARSNLRNWARYLDENHDLAVGILDSLTDAVVGSGLVWEPMVKTGGRQGALHKPTNDRLRQLWNRYWEYPEVSREHTGHQIERLICRSWLRDGEVFVHHLEGRVSGLQHWSAVPYSLELLEADLLPWDLIDDRVQTGNKIIHGVEKGAWQEPLAYWFFREHPGNSPLLSGITASFQDLTRVRAQDISHIKFVRRLGQTRGVTVLHAVIQRLDDLKDLEEAERIAAKVAASLTAAITKSVDADLGAEDIDSVMADRSFYMKPGMVADSLLPGEDVSVIKSERPNPDLIEFRADQLRAVASGTGASYSTISKRYDGSYSSQRQELVENQPQFERIRSYFCELFAKPIWDRFVRLAVTSGQLPTPALLDFESLSAVNVRQSGGIPWIDPQKEVQADLAAIQGRLTSRREIIRKRGGDPDLIDAEIELDPPMQPETENDAPPRADESDEAA